MFQTDLMAPKALESRLAHITDMVAGVPARHPFRAAREERQVNEEHTGLPLRERFADVARLEDYLTTPSLALQRELSTLDGDIMVMGVGGKMGPTLARMAKRAAPAKRVIGVARFSDRERLEGWGVECLPCDVLDAHAVRRATTAWLIETTHAQRLFDPPRASMSAMLDWVARWIADAGPSLGKDTHFGTRDGKH